MQAYNTGAAEFIPGGGGYAQPQYRQQPILGPNGHPMYPPQPQFVQQQQFVSYPQVQGMPVQMPHYQQNAYPGPGGAPTFIQPGQGQHAGNFQGGNKGARNNQNQQSGQGQNAPNAPPQPTGSASPSNKGDRAAKGQGKDAAANPEQITFGSLPPGPMASTEKSTPQADAAPTAAFAAAVKNGAKEGASANKDKKNDDRVAKETKPIAEKDTKPVDTNTWSKTAASAPTKAAEKGAVKDNAPLARGASVSPKGGAGGNAAQGEGGASGWRRGESMASGAQVLKEKGVYDKQTILSFFTKGKVCPEEIKTQYPVHSKSERSPLAPKPQGQGGGGGGHNKPQGNKKYGKNEPEEPHPDEAAIFNFANKDEKTFTLNRDRLADGTDPEVICSKAKLILNKLSVTKFEKLSDEFMNCGLYSDDLMNRAVEMIVVKAQMEEHFCFMYADLCRKMTDCWVEVDEKGEPDQSVDLSSDENSLGKQFRGKLLSRCQLDFNIDRTQALADIQQSDSNTDDKEEKVILLKKRYTGHMRFVGELYLKDLVSPKVMHFCITEFLSATEEETLVCLIKLLTTVGSKLESYDKRKGHDSFNDYFSKISDIHGTHSSSRMRYMLFDLMDLRKDGWRLRNEVEKAVDISQIRNPNQKGNNRGGGSPRNNGSGDARSGGNASADGWETVVSTKKGGSGGSGKSGKGFGSRDNLKDADKGSSFGKSGSSNAFGALASSGGRKSPGAQVEDDETKGWGKGSRVAKDTAKEGASGASSPTKEAKDLPGADGTVTKETIVKVRAIVEEYYMNGDDSEALDTIKEAVHANGMGKVIGQPKGCIDLVFEKFPQDRSKFCKLMAYLHEQNFLTSAEVKSAVLLFLDNLDETIIDTPKALVYGADILAEFLSLNLFDMADFSNISDDNMFSMSFRRAAFFGELLTALVSKTSAEKVAAMYTESKLDVLADIQTEPKQSQEEAVAAFFEKHSTLLFLK